jgi:hypothetical protein
MNSFNLPAWARLTLLKNAERSSGAGGKMLEFDVSESKLVARELYRVLSDAGIAVWFDEVALIPGTRLDSELRNAIASATVVLMLVGKCPPGEWQTVELRSVLDRAVSDERFRVIPVLLPGSAVESLPPALRAYQSIDLRDAPDEDSKLKRIAAALRASAMTWRRQLLLSLCAASGRTIWCSARSGYSRLLASGRFVTRLQGASASRPAHVFLPSGITPKRRKECMQSDENYRWLGWPLTSNVS